MKEADLPWDEVKTSFLRRRDLYLEQKNGLKKRTGSLYVKFVRVLREACSDVGRNVMCLKTTTWKGTHKNRRKRRCYGTFLKWRTTNFGEKMQVLILTSWQRNVHPRGNATYADSVTREIFFKCLIIIFLCFILMLLDCGSFGISYLHSASLI